MRLCMEQPNYRMNPLTNSGGGPLGVLVATCLINLYGDRLNLPRGLSDQN
jgi:hypothetical protein